MLVAPKSYLRRYKNVSYFELLKLKDELVEDITTFETDYDMKAAGWGMNPGPSVQYQWNLEVLGGITSMLKDAFNKEFIWGNQNFSEYYKQMKEWKIREDPPQEVTEEHLKFINKNFPEN